MDTWGKLDAERAALCEDLAGLDAAQWDVQSLCDKWKVRHVVAHLARAPEMKGVAAVTMLLASGLSFNRAMERDALKFGAAPPAELLAKLKGIVGSRVLPIGTNTLIMLTDTMCHAADIRRPLGLSRDVPEDSMVEVADRVKDLGFPLGAKKRIVGLKLSATDVEWSTGDGPSVEGPLMSLILAMGGRPSALADLSGEGLATLQARA